MRLTLCDVRNIYIYIYIHVTDSDNIFVEHHIKLSIVLYVTYINQISRHERCTLGKKYNRLKLTVTTGRFISNYYGDFH